MSTQFEEIEKQARSLPLEQKATLARLLIEELDLSVDPDAEQLWIAEAQRRYAAFQNGELDSAAGEDVMKRARERLK